jgi:hypothetical protein
MSSARKKTTKRAAKPPPRKAVTPKGAAARKKPAKPRREETTPAPEPAAAAPRPRAAAAKAAAPTAKAPPVAPDRRGRLGAKWVCFKCNAKFYDLNKPEPLCPKCGANQNDRPKRDPKPKQPLVEAPAPRAIEPERDMLPIEEEDEDALLMEDEEIDLGTPELEGDSEEFPEEEEEEPGEV